MDKKSAIEFYEQYSELFLNPNRDNEFYKTSVEAMKTSDLNIHLSEHFLVKEFDVAWIEAIEKAIVPLDMIIRNPRKFIKNDEDIVPIEMSRKITTESVKHLAQHTNMIAQVKEDDSVIPNRILEVRKEESLETYENRFTYTLLTKLQYFIEKRLKLIQDKSYQNNEYRLGYSGNYKLGKDRISYNVDIRVDSENTSNEEEAKALLNADVNELSLIERVERIRMIIYDFMATKFAKEMVDKPLIKPPLTLTNALKKNPNYVALVDLWMFIERYEGLGIKLGTVDREQSPRDEFQNQILSLTMLQYMALRRNTNGDFDLSDKDKDDTKVVTSYVTNIKDSIDEVIELYDFDLETVRKVVIDTITKKQKARQKVDSKIIKLVQKALEDETKKA